MVALLFTNGHHYLSNKQILMAIVGLKITIYMVYLVVALIWRFTESRVYCQINCTPFML